MQNKKLHIDVTFVKANTYAFPNINDLPIVVPLKCHNYKIYKINCAEMSKLIQNDLMGRSK